MTARRALLLFAALLALVTTSACVSPVEPDPVPSGGGGNPPFAQKTVSVILRYERIAVENRDGLGQTLDGVFSLGDKLERKLCSPKPTGAVSNFGDLEAVPSEFVCEQVEIPCGGNNEVSVSDPARDRGSRGTNIVARRLYLTIGGAEVELIKVASDIPPQIALFGLSADCKIMQ